MSFGAGRYQGSWRDGGRAGEGVCEYANGDIYQGKSACTRESVCERQATTSSLRQHRLNGDHDDKKKRTLRYSRMCKIRQQSAAYNAFLLDDRVHS